MTRVSVIGMSGTGKSSVLAEHSRRGYRVVDTDEHELDASRPLYAIVDDLIAIAGAA
jgi:dephospho-CoA kinase